MTTTKTASKANRKSSKTLLLLVTRRASTRFNAADIEAPPVHRIAIRDLEALASAVSVPIYALVRRRSLFQDLPEQRDLRVPTNWRPSRGPARARVPGWREFDEKRVVSRTNRRSHA